jgi:hypothetical protein
VKLFFAFLTLLFFIFTNIAAQQEDLLDLNIDSLFDEPLSETPEKEEPEKKGTNTASVLDSVRRRGLTIDASFEFQGGLAPGWDTRPWEFNGKEVYSHGLGVKMNSSMSLDAQMSEAFRARTVVTFTIPGFSFELGDFFFDYNFFDRVFVRAGKYEHSWGISPNYGFTNLLSRVPGEDLSGPSYIFKADVPIGIGGAQALFMTRVNMMGGVIPEHRKDFAFGGKYNLAFHWADFDLGVFYQDEMATRGFFSAKTTLWDIEFYNEWLVAVNTHTDNEASFAVNFGFGRQFFNEKLEVNGEFFYNGEGNAYFYRPETEIREAETSPFIEGINLALNLLYRFSGKADMRFFTQVLYAPMQNSLQLVPGFRLTPVSHIEIYAAVPMALGSRDAYYYFHTADPNNRPFSVMFLVTLKGSVRAGYFY